MVGKELSAQTMQLIPKELSNKRPIVVRDDWEAIKKMKMSQLHEVLNEINMLQVRTVLVKIDTIRTIWIVLRERLVIL